MKTCQPPVLGIARPVDPATRRPGPHARQQATLISSAVRRTCTARTDDLDDKGPTLDWESGLMPDVYPRADFAASR